jgi:hypothetical protein
MSCSLTLLGIRLADKIDRDLEIALLKKLVEQVDKLDVEQNNSQSVTFPPTEQQLHDKRVREELEKQNGQTER